MTPQEQEFDAELRHGVHEHETTHVLVDRLGNGIAHETNLIYALKRQVEANRDARFALMETLAEPQRMPLDPTRREQLQNGIAENLPRYLDQQASPTISPAAAYQPHHSQQTPPPIPGSGPQAAPTREMHAADWTLRKRAGAQG